MRTWERRYGVPEAARTEANHRLYDPEVASWIRDAHDLDAKALHAGLRAACARLGVVRFLEEAATPFLVEIGDAWARGDLQTFHEHFASERLRDFLVDIWRPMADAAGGGDRGLRDVAR